jgi:hypothetical protein
MCWNKYSFIDIKTYTSGSDIALDTVTTLGFVKPRRVVLFPIVAIAQTGPGLYTALCPFRSEDNFSADKTDGP